MKGLKIGIMTVLLTILSISFMAGASADVKVDYVRINGERVDHNENLRVSLGDDLNIRVRLTAGNVSNIENLEVMARLIGFEYWDYEGALIDIDGPYTMDKGDTINADLRLRFPMSGDKDEYELRITVGDRRYDYDTHRVTLRVRDPRSMLHIRDVIMSPGGVIESGRALLVQTRVENLGTRDLRDVTIRAEIPALGLVGTAFIDDRIRGSNVDRGDIKTSEEILLRIPPCASTGTYEVFITAEYDRYSKTSLMRTVQVEQSNACAQTTTVPTETTQITPPQSKTLTIGSAGESFPVVITNMGTTARSYTVSVTGVSAWGIAEVDRPAVVVQPGASEIVYVFVSANSDANPGQQMFTIAVNDRTIPVTVRLEQSTATASGDGWIRALEIGLIVLVVLLIIIGLIVAFARMRSDEDGDEGKTYY